MKKSFLICVAVLAMCIVGCPKPDRHVGNNGHSHIDRHDRPDAFSNQDLLREHNMQRRDHHMKELYCDRDLENAAQKWAEHMCSRNRLYHGSLRSKVNLEQWDTVGENIAWGQRDAREVVDSWMDSPGHRRNILNRDFYHVGFGVAYDRDGRPYWCAIFGGLKTELDRRRP